ncbi:hypothetical protein HY989_06330 [Candidatus Micrarchaeota archaeon]|nr:hypothetical protein [Candidatus Micrarchaeota archaeon]
MDVKAEEIIANAKLAKSPDKFVDEFLFPLMRYGKIKPSLKIVHHDANSGGITSIVFHNKEAPNQNILLSLGQTERKQNSRRFSQFYMHVAGIRVPIKGDFRDAKRKFGSRAFQHRGKFASISHRICFPKSIFESWNGKISRSKTGETLIHADLGPEAFNKLSRFEGLKLIDNYIDTIELIHGQMNEGKYAKHVKLDRTIRNRLPHFTFTAINGKIIIGETNPPLKLVKYRINPEPPREVTFPVFPAKQFLEMMNETRNTKFFHLAHDSKVTLLWDEIAKQPPSNIVSKRFKKFFAQKHEIAGPVVDQYIERLINKLIDTDPVITHTLGSSLYMGQIWQKNKVK